MGPKRYDYAGTMVFLRHRYLSLQTKFANGFTMRELRRSIFTCHVLKVKYHYHSIAFRLIGLVLKGGVEFVIETGNEIE